MAQVTRVVNDIVEETIITTVVVDKPAITITVTPGDFARIISALSRTGHGRVSWISGGKDAPRHTAATTIRPSDVDYYDRMVALANELREEARRVGADPLCDLSE